VAVLLTALVPGRLDNNVAILRGSEEDAPGQLIKGTVVLCLSEPLSVKNIGLEFKGESRVA
jgi:arrestin-related trafficking adapter 4/5/7